MVNDDNYSGVRDLTKVSEREKETNLDLPYVCKLQFTLEKFKLTKDFSKF